MMLRKRLDNDIKQGKDNIQWVDYIFQIMLTYNNKNEHNSINMTPVEATKEDKQLDVKLNLELKAKRDRKYPDLKIHDKVKIMLKYNKMKKEHNPLYSDMKYEIEKIEEKNGLTFYYVNGRPRLRNEILKTI